MLQSMGLERVGHDWLTELNTPVTCLVRSVYALIMILHLFVRKPMDFFRILSIGIDFYASSQALCFLNFMKVSRLKAGET